MEIIDLAKPIISNTLKLHGRYYRQNGILWMNFSGSGIEFAFYGTSSSIKIVATATDDKIHRPYLMIFVDDLAPKKCEINQPEMEILLVENLALCHHHIRVMKISESSSSHVGYRQAETDGSFLLLKEKKKMISPLKSKLLSLRRKLIPTLFSPRWKDMINTSFSLCQRKNQSK